jgi:hypothetical protein
LLVAVVCLAATSCESSKTPETEARAEAMSPEQQQGASARPDEHDTTLEGLLIVDLMPTDGKTIQGSWLYTDDGKVLLDYRPVEQFRPYHERRVQVRGEFYEPTGQALMVDHFRTSDVELVGDQKPRELEDGGLPDPIFVESADDLEAIDERLLEAHTFVTAHGRIEELGDDTPLTDGLLRLEDGTEVRLDRVNPDIPAASPGERTVGGVLYRDDEGWRIAVRAWAVCEGTEPQCGVEVP